MTPQVQRQTQKQQCHAAATSTAAATRNSRQTTLSPASASSSTSTNTGSSPQVFITNMNDLSNQDIFPVIKTVVSEEWKEPSDNPTEGLSKTKEPTKPKSPARQVPVNTGHVPMPPPQPLRSYYSPNPPGYHHPSHEYALHPRHLYAHQGSRPPHLPFGGYGGGVFRGDSGPANGPHLLTCRSHPTPPSYSNYPQGSPTIFPSYSYPIPPPSHQQHVTTKRQHLKSSTDRDSCREEEDSCREEEDIALEQKRRRTSDDRHQGPEERSWANAPRDAVSIQQSPPSRRDFSRKARPMLLADPTTSWGRPSGTMTPKLSTGGNDNKEGKQLVLTVSASPTNHTAKKEDQAASRGENMATLSENRTASFDSECSHKNQDSPGPLYQDSPGPAFVAMMGDFGDDDLMNESSSSCHEYHSSVASFNLLPLLDGDDRASPPLIPYLGKSRQPSWEMADEGAAPNNESDNNGLKKAGQNGSKRHHSTMQEDCKFNIKPQIQMSASWNNEMQNHVMIQQCDTWPRQSSEVFQRRDPPEQAGSQNDLPRDDTFLHRARSFDSRDKAPPSNALRSTDIFRNPPPSMRLFHQPPSYRVPAMMSSLPPQQSPPFRYPVGRAGTSGLQSTQGSPVAVNYQQRLHQSRTENQNLRKMIGESKGRCVALGHPLPRSFQGDTEKCKNEPVPEFSSLVNFPTNTILRQNHVLPNGMRCCVMCGCVRPTCSRIRQRRANDNYSQSPKREGSNAVVAGPDDFVTIPTQNKGLCTLCDISVWVVLETGSQIKWCKGCKNFRPWAGFGDKGLATKCLRCRERQREKYALLKDAKRK